MLLLGPHVATLTATAGAGAPLAVDIDQPLPGLSVAAGTYSLFGELGTAANVALPVLVVLALLVGATISALNSPSRGAALRRGWEFGPVLAVITLGVAVGTRVAVQGGVLGLRASGGLHLHYLFAPLVMLAWGAALGTLVP